MSDDDDRDNERGTRIYVGGLSEETRKEDLEAEFEKFGPLNNVWIAFNPPGFAFIEFANRVDAENACENMNGVDFLGGRLRVELSRSRGRGGYRGGAPRGGPNGGGGFRGRGRAGLPFGGMRDDAGGPRGGNRGSGDHGRGRGRASLARYYNNYGEFEDGNMRFGDYRNEPNGESGGPSTGYRSRSPVGRGRRY